MASGRKDRVERSGRQDVEIIRLVVAVSLTDNEVERRRRRIDGLSRRSPGHRKGN